MIEEGSVSCGSTQQAWVQLKGNVCDGGENEDFDLSDRQSESSGSWAKCYGCWLL